MSLAVGKEEQYLRRELEAACARLEARAAKRSLHHFPASASGPVLWAGIAMLGEPPLYKQISRAFRGLSPLLITPLQASSPVGGHL